MGDIPKTPVHGELEIPHAQDPIIAEHRCGAGDWVPSESVEGRGAAVDVDRNFLQVIDDPHQPLHHGLVEGPALLGRGRPRVPRISGIPRILPRLLHGLGKVEARGLDRRSRMGLSQSGLRV